MNNPSSHPSSPPEPLFPRYLLPSIPFRRRRQSSSSSLSLSPRQSLSHHQPSSPSIASPTSPLEDPSFPNRGSAAYRNSPFGYSYDFHPQVAAAARHDSTSSTASSASSSSALSPSPGPLPSFLSGHAAHISCARCHADLALTSQIISKGFTGRHGRAYLVAPWPCDAAAELQRPGKSSRRATTLPNTTTHAPVPRHLVTGLHTVADLACAHCGLVVGWKYVAAEDVNQRYKVGKFILETRRCSVGACWEVEEEAEDKAAERKNSEEDDGGWFFGGAGMEGVDERREESEDEDEDEVGDDGGHDLADVLFDSQDEDECEDLFAGVWSPALARKRRARKAVLVARRNQSTRS